MITSALFAFSCILNSSNITQSEAVSWKYLSVHALVKKNVNAHSEDIHISIKNTKTGKVRRHVIYDDYGDVSGLYILSGKHCDLFYHADRYIAWLRISATGSLIKMQYPWYSDKNLPNASIVPHVCGISRNSLLYCVAYNGTESVGIWRYYRYDANTAKWQFYEGVEAP